MAEKYPHCLSVTASNMSGNLNQLKQVLYVPNDILKRQYYLQSWHI